MSLALEPKPIAVAQASVAARFEREFLVALAFVLPLFEAPKNILWIGLVAIWLVNRCRARDLGGPWDLWDTLVVVWIGSGFAAAAFAGIRGDEWRAAADIVRYGSVFWILKRSRYPDSTWIALIAAIIAGTVVALAWSFYGVYHATAYRALNLNSVGHVYQSAHYLAIVCGVTLIATRAWWGESSRSWRALGCASLGLLVVSLFWMQSRASVGAAFVMALALLCAYTVRRRGSLRWVALAGVLAVGAVMVISPQVVQKNTRFVEKNYWLNGRDDIWRVGLAAWREFPIFGVGMDNFGRVDYELLESWSAKRGEKFDRGRYLSAPHGHSLFINSLAERGIVGLSVVLALLGAWAAALFRRLPDVGARPLAWTYWGGAAAAWMITVLAGVLNTTLHHEQALLCALLLGGWLSLSRRI